MLSRAVSLLIASAALLLVRGGAVAETPTPGPQPVVGLRHVATVLDREGKPANEGTIVVLTRRLSRDEYFKARDTGLGPSSCATLAVQSSRVQINPSFTNDCPEGAAISVSINYNDGRGWISGNFEPPLEWRSALSGESSKQVVLKPDQPHEGGNTYALESSTTADSAADNAGQTGGWSWYRSTMFGVVVLALAAGLLVVKARSRRG
jgi:hypothetical protein